MSKRQKQIVAQGLYLRFLRRKFVTRVESLHARIREPGVKETLCLLYAPGDRWGKRPSKQFKKLRMSSTYGTFKEGSVGTGSYTVQFKKMLASSTPTRASTSIRTETPRLAPSTTTSAQTTPRRCSSPPPKDDAHGC
jgi:hypothetical protein